MSRTMGRVLRIILLILLAFAACLIFPRRATEAEQHQFVHADPQIAQVQAGRSLAANSQGKGRSPAEASRKKFPSSSLQSLRNIGKAYYEQAKYVEAIEEFKNVIASGNALATDHFNLGLALMQASKLDEALASFTTAGQMDPKLIPVDYNLGILFKRELRYPDAQAALQRVIEVDPHDPATWFNLGTVYFAQRKLEDALKAHGHVVEMGFGEGQNFYVASLFHSFTTLVRLKRPEDAQKFLKMHETMRDAVPKISLQNPALEGGKYGAILVPPSPVTTVMRRSGTSSITFSDVTARLGVTGTPPSDNSPPEALPGIKRGEYSLEYARRELLPRFGASLAIGDVNQDGWPDLYVANPSGGSRLYQNNGDGTYADVTEKFGLPASEAAFSAVFVDHNNGACTSLLVTGVSGVRLYRHQGDGNGKCDGIFVDDTERAGLNESADEPATAAAFFDGDNDGFVDLIVGRYTDLNSPPKTAPFTFPNDFEGKGVRYYRNNGDGTFANRTSSSGFGSVSGRVRKILFGDFDNDGYTDAVVLRDDAAPLIYFGKGECRFVNRTGEAGKDFVQTVAVDGAVTDFNHDGSFDLMLWSTAGYQVLMNHGGGRFSGMKGLPSIAPPIGVFAFRGTVADVDGDSFDDLLLADSEGRWHWLANRAGKFREEELALPVEETGFLGALRSTWISAAGRLNLVGVTRAGEVAALEKEGPPSNWLEVKMSGFKSNMYGIGSIVELKAGNFYKKLLVSDGRVRVYTGDLRKLDVVRVTWPNAVVQNWVNVATNKPMEVRESERLASSCPFLYVWNGTEFEYKTDVLGVGPLGHLLPSGDYIRPNPEELVRLGEELVPRNGRYVFQLTDELREVDYFDQVRLFAVDHPASEGAYSNEIFSESLGSPTLHVVTQKRSPAAARDQLGRDVRPLVRSADGEYAASFRRLGIPGLASEHALELDLGELEPADPVVLYLRGWVYWTDSNSHRALVSNRAVQLEPPYLQVRDAAGKWKTVIQDMGLPSGTDRTMRVDLTGKFLSDRREVRIVTNMCVYWDEAFFTTHEGQAPKPLELPLVSADLHYRGFSTPVLDPHGVKPERFDYTKVMAEAPWNPMVGNYTRYGDVRDLVKEADDHLVVMATGDELTVEFEAGNLPPLQRGWKRTFFLYAHGWAKDGEPNTAYSRTVEPLPFREMSGYPLAPGERGPDTPEYRDYLRQYQTRPRYELIPSLAPIH